MSDLDLFAKHSLMICNHFCPDNPKLHVAIMGLVTDAYEIGMEAGRAPYIRTSLENQVREIVTKSMECPRGEDKIEKLVSESMKRTKGEGWTKQDFARAFRKFLRLDGRI